MNVEVLKIGAQEMIVGNTPLPIMITRKSEQSKNED